MDRREFLKAAVVGGAQMAMTARGLCGPPGAAAPGAKLDAAAAARALGEHRIARIDARRLQDRYPRSVGPNSRGRPVGRGGGYQVRAIVTDRGAAGWGMCHAGDAQVKRFVGTRVSDLFDLRAGTADEAFILDKLLYDLAGNILHRPTYELLGGSGPRQVDLYSGAIYMEDVVPPGRERGVRAVVDACRQDYEAGYRAFKLKIGRGRKWMERAAGLRRDIEVTRAVRKAFGDCKVLVDANDAYTVDEAITYVQAVADCDLYWIEEPFEEDRDGLKRLREAMAKAGCKAMIADGEARKDRAAHPTACGGYTQKFVDHLYALAAEKLVDVFLWDLGIVGFTRWRRIMPALVKAQVKASPHTWMWTPRPYYAAQLAAGVGNVCIVEGIPGAARGIDYSAYRIKDGKLMMPDAPGFGLRLVG